MTTLNLVAIKARHAAATPGPWRWWGNTDSHNIALVGHQPGLGVCEVISTLGVERDPKGRDADRIREYARDGEMTDEEVEEEVEKWATDAWGELHRDDRMAITDEHYIRHNAENLAVYEVARAQGLPEDTPREHPKVYRGDVVDLRNANARFLAAAWKDVADLVAEVERLLAALDDLDDNALESGL
jgi:hypothetical protein